MLQVWGLLHHYLDRCGVEREGVADTFDEV